MKSDRQLKKDVEEELEWDPAVTATDIGVEVTDRVVTLSGHPPSYAEKLAAEKAAHRVAGVRAVVVEMQVRLPQRDERTDEDIGSAVHDIVHWTVGLPDDSVKVQVEKGWVTLTGVVDWA
ncbi:BON domain-containing protein, partial [Paraburkholderia hospita]|uniref:BON domain-containing protein n=1 Tax=Paraburkholderia hospita TaxID=169430 RepID=UPI000B6F9A2B